MIVNPDKFQSIKSEWSWFRHEQKEKINLNINRAEIKSQNSVTLLRAEIDNEFKFLSSLVWHFSTKKSTNKIENIKSIAYKITLIITTLLKHR